jgi:hypothetical protein
MNNSAKVVGIGQAARKRERLQEVAKTFIEDVTYVKVLLGRTLAPAVGREVLDTLDKIGEAAEYFYLGKEPATRDATPRRAADRYHQGMSSTLNVVAKKLAEVLAADRPTVKELSDVAMLLGFGVDAIHNYLAAVDIEREIELANGQQSILED